MRTTIIIALAALAACSSGGGDERNAATPAPENMEAGLWEVTHEVSSITPADQAATTAIKAKAGDKTSARICMSEAEGAKPDPALFVGEDYECAYRDSYISNGRLNASLNCERKDVKGEIMMMVDGDYKAGSFEASINANSYLPGDGDFRMTTKVAGRHIGACLAEPAGNEAAATTEGE